jgi:hypothetical protein
MRALLLATLLFGCAPVPANPPTAPRVAAAEKRAIGVERRFVTNKVPAAHVEWLAITLPSEAAGAAITTTLERAARKSLKEFLAAARDAKKDEPRELPGMPSADRWELRTTCRTTALRPTLVSVRCDEYTYTGGAHGMEHAFGRTWQIVGDKANELTLDDLFVAPYLDVLDKKLVAELRARDADWFVDGSMKSVAGHLHTWNVTKDGVEFVFDPYEVGSYAQGMHEVLLPWKALDTIRRRPGPLDAVAP